MGLLINGIWNDQWYDTEKTQGEFVREKSQFRQWISKQSDAIYKAELNRYHLYVSFACPWAHRTLIFRKLKALEEHISISVVHPEMLSNGWEFRTDFPGSTGDILTRKKFLWEIYTAANPNFTGRVSTPVLWDKKTKNIVNNESSEIIRMFNSEFNDLTGNSDDYYPIELREEIDELNQKIYLNINDGVYKAGFATQQKVYEKHVNRIFAALDWLEIRLDNQRFLLGEKITESDWRLFTTLIRFDTVYFGHFKCNNRPLTSYPNLINYVRELYQIPGIADTVNFSHIKQHYYFSHTRINPNQIVPVGPELDFDTPHDRQEKFDN